MKIETSNGVYQVRAWTGGDVPPAGLFGRDRVYAGLVRWFFRDQVEDSGGLGLWACAGTSALERARIFWQRARLDAWRTMSDGRLA